MFSIACVLSSDNSTFIHYLPMQINPSLLLFMLVIFVFTPSIQEWATHGGTAWYRPFELWLIVIVFIFWSQRRKENKENKKKSNNADES